MTAPGKQNDPAAVSDSVESTRQEELIPIPEALYSCHICREDCSWPADSLFWSPKLETWICSECYDESEHGDRGPRLVDEIKRRAPSVGGAQQTPGEKEAATADAPVLQKTLSLLSVAKCPNADCDGGAIPVPLGEHFVSHEMAMDAGEPSMEGASMGVEWGVEQCQWCDERKELLANIDAPSVERGTENQPVAQGSPETTELGKQEPVSDNVNAVLQNVLQILREVVARHPYSGETTQELHRLCEVWQGSPEPTRKAEQLLRWRKTLVEYEKLLLSSPAPRSDSGSGSTDDSLSDARAEVSWLERCGYIIAMRLLQSDLHLDADELAAIELFVPKRPAKSSGSGSTKQEEKE